MLELQKKKKERKFCIPKVFVQQQHPEMKNVLNYISMYRSFITHWGNTEATFLISLLNCPNNAMHIFCVLLCTTAVGRNLNAFENSCRKGNSGQ